MIVSQFTDNIKKVSSFGWKVAVIAVILLLTPVSDEVSVLGFKFNGAAVTYGLPILVLLLLTWRAILVWNLTYLVTRASDSERSQFGDYIISAPILEFVRWKETPLLIGIVTTIGQLCYELIGPVVLLFALSDRGPVWWAWFVSLVTMVLHTVAYKMLREDVFSAVCGEIDTPD